MTHLRLWSGSNLKSLTSSRREVTTRTAYPGGIAPNASGVSRLGGTLS